MPRSALYLSHGLCEYRGRIQRGRLGAQCPNRRFSMRTFLYKRTHKGDPDTKGCFGVEDCMGGLRNCEFDAVIGIGGICRWARDEGISRKINWIGIGPTKKPRNRFRGPLVTFDHFLIFEEKGQDFGRLAPTLAGRLYHRKAPRFLFSDGFNRSERAEVRKILRLAKAAPPSTGRRYQRAKSVPCHPKCV